MSEHTSRTSCPIHDAHAVRATLRGAGWRAGVGCLPRTHCATEYSGSGLLHNECIHVGEFVVAEYPVVSDETAEFVCERCNEPISMTEAVLYP